MSTGKSSWSKLVGHCPSGAQKKMAARPSNTQALLRVNAGRFSVERASRIRAEEFCGWRSTQFRQHRESSPAMMGATITTKMVLWRTDVSEAYAKPRMSSGSTIFFWDKSKPHKATPVTSSKRNQSCGLERKVGAWNSWIISVIPDARKYESTSALSFHPKGFSK